MKKLFRYALLFAAVAGMSASCAKEQIHEAGEPEEEGCYGVYFPAQDLDLTLDPADDMTFTIIAARTNSNGDITVPLTITDTSGLFNFSPLVFEDGQTESYITVTFDIEVGVSYTGSLLIDDFQYASRYSSNPIAVDFSVVREKWNLLGEGTWYEDGYFGFYDPVSVEIWQNDNDHNQYRIPMRWTEDDGTTDYLYTESSDEYFYFYVLEPGNSLAGVTITTSDLVYFDIFDTGYYNSNYPSAPIWFVHPANFSAYADESYWTYNKVLQWQEADGDDEALPAGVQIAPYYYINGVGGWNYSQEDGVLTIMFPGGVLTDYSLEIQAGTSQDGELPVVFTYGTDVASAKYTVYEGSLSDAVAALRAQDIIDGNVEAYDVPEGGSFYLSFDATGIYTIIGVTYDADGIGQESAWATVHYVAAGDSMPVAVGAGIESTGKYEGMGYSSDNILEYYIYGEDLLDVKTLLVPESSYSSSSVEALLDSDSLDADVLAEINDGGTVGVYTGLTPGTTYYFLVYASNGYEETVLVSSAKTTGMLDVELEEMFGVYNVVFNSSFYGNGLEEEWVLEQSDNETLGNIMITEFCGFSGISPIYGTFDKESYTISFDSDQYIMDYPEYGAMYFMSISGDPVSFDVTGKGSFSGPSETLYVYIPGAGSLEAYTSISATKTSDVTTGQSHSTASLAGKRNVFDTSSVQMSKVATTRYETVLCGPREATVASFTAKAASVDKSKLTVSSKNRSDTKTRKVESTLMLNNAR